MNCFTRTGRGVLVACALTITMPVTLTGCGDAATVAVEEENLTTLNFSVTGMHCQGCVSSVRNAIARIDGVRSCDVSLADESAIVKVTDAEASQRIVDAVAALEFTIEQRP